MPASMVSTQALIDEFVSKCDTNFGTELTAIDATLTNIATANYFKYPLPFPGSHQMPSMEFYEAEDDWIGTYDSIGS